MKRHMNGNGYNCLRELRFHHVCTQGAFPTLVWGEYSGGQLSRAHWIGPCRYGSVLESKEVQGPPSETTVSIRFRTLYQDRLVLIEVYRGVPSRKLRRGTSNARVKIRVRKSVRGNGDLACRRREQYPSLLQ